MPLINLIHEQRQLVRQRERKVRVLLLATIGLGTFAFLSSGYFLFNAARYQVMVGALESKKRALDPLIKRLKANELDQRVLEPKLTTLTNATKATDQWYKLMNHLVVNVPPTVWLTNIKTTTATDKDGGVSLVFGGYSLSHDEVGEFLLRLETCPELEGVTLRFSQERAVEKDKMLEFEISAFLAGSKNTKKIKEKESA